MSKTYTVSERMGEVMTKAIDIHYTNAIRIAKEMSAGNFKNAPEDTDNDVCNIPFGDLTFSISVMCDDEGERWMPSIYLGLLTTSLKFISIHDVTLQAGLMAVKQSIGETLSTCSIDECKQKSIKDGLCERCYIWATTQDEPCCVCHENEREVWYKLKCGHMMHQKCWKKMEGTKCPLCRSESCPVKLI
jgi:hypothetical protein